MATHDIRKYRFNPTLTRGFGLLAALICLVYVTLRFTQNSGGRREIHSIGEIRDRNARITRFTRQEQDSVKESYFGFWHSTCILGCERDTFAVTDRVEVKRNGIVWAVKSFRAVADTHTSAFVHEVMHAYHNPYGYDSVTNSIVTETRILRKYLLTGDDTCVTAATKDTLWEFDIGLPLAFIGGVRYRAFDSTRLDEFFPPGILDITRQARITYCDRDETFSHAVWVAVAEMQPSDVCRKWLESKNSLPYFVDN